MVLYQSTSRHGIIPSPVNHVSTGEGKETEKTRSTMQNFFLPVAKSFVVGKPAFSQKNPGRRL